MDVIALMGEIATKLTATGLRVAPIGSDTVLPPPSAVIYLPDSTDYDQSYGRGSVKVNDLAVVLLVAGTTRRTAPLVLQPYLADSGAKSIKYAVDMATAGPYTNAFDVQVTRYEIDYAARMNDVEYLAVLFHINAEGSGRT